MVKEYAATTYRFSVDFVAAATTTTFQQLIANNQFD